MQTLTGGSMMMPMLLSMINEHGAVSNGGCEVISHELDGTRCSFTFAQMNARTKRLANALLKRGMGLGHRGTTIAWNTHRHMELFYGLTGIGSAIHTANPRLAQDQLTYVVNEGGGEILFFDADILPQVEAMAADLPNIRHFVVLAEPAAMPSSSTLKLECYEDWLAAEDASFDWPTFDETTAATICFTSGTTGLPKGVVYAHRDCFLQTMILSSHAWLPMPVRNPLVMMPLAPMFHSSAWNYPFGAFFMGRKLVLTGRDMAPASIIRLINTERVTNIATASSVMMMLLNHVDDTGGTFDPLETLITASTGMPPPILRRLGEEFGMKTAHNWGMTECMFGSSGMLPGNIDALPLDAQVPYKAIDGRQTPGFVFKLVDDTGQPVPHDGATRGHLRVKGLWAAKSYLNRADGSACDADGWLDTGDVATIDAEGYMKIVDRSKDLIKSGGEWIPSITLENAALAHPSVAQVAAIAVDHPKWQERPLMVVVRKPGAALTERELLDFMAPKMAKWWVPDGVVFVDKVEVNANGKIRKNLLRDAYRRHLIS
jgi:acyl-CoA synthetase (AMP-forming)/AMP-acid ligase II